MVGVRQVIGTLSGLSIKSETRYYWTLSIDNIKISKERENIVFIAVTYDGEPVEYIFSKEYMDNLKKRFARIIALRRALYETKEY